MIRASYDEEMGYELVMVKAWISERDDTSLYNFPYRKESLPTTTETKVIQIDVGDQTHPKLIYISESLSLMEKQDLISLIKEYTDIFAWSYENMHGFDPQVAMHHLNIKLDAKPVK